MVANQARTQAAGTVTGTPTAVAGATTQVITTTTLTPAQIAAAQRAGTLTATTVAAGKSCYDRTLLDIS